MSHGTYSRPIPHFRAESPCPAAYVYRFSPSVGRRRALARFHSGVPARLDYPADSGPTAGRRVVVVQVVPTLGAVRVEPGVQGMRVPHAPGADEVFAVGQDDGSAETPSHPSHANGAVVCLVIGDSFSWTGAWGWSGVSHRDLRPCRTGRSRRAWCIHNPWRRARSACPALSSRTVRIVLVVQELRPDLSYRSSARGRDACLELQKGKPRHAQMRPRRKFTYGEGTFHR